MALTAARMTRSRRLGNKVQYLMTASQTVYAGGMVMLVDAGTAQAAAASASNSGVVGIATETVTSAASGNYYVTVQEGEFLMAGTTLALTSQGQLVYAEDDLTVDETQGANEPVAGVMVEYVGASSCWVKMGITEGHL